MVKKRLSYEELERDYSILRMEYDILRNSSTENAIEGEIKFRSTFLYSGIGMAIVGLDKHFIKVNPAFCRLFEYSEEEFKNKRIIDITYFDDANIGLNDIVRAINGEIDHFKCQKRYVKKSGLVFYANLNASIVRGSNNEPICFIAQIEDNSNHFIYESELREAKEIAEQNEKFYKITFEDAAVGIAHVYPNGDFFKVNKKFCDITGYDEHEINLINISDITFPDDLNMEKVFIEQVLAKKLDSFVIEKRYVHKSGGIIWVLLTSNVVRDSNGDIKFAIATINDITKQKELHLELLQAKEKAEESDKLKTAFIHNMSHEIRTPMNAIMGFSELMAKSYNNKEKLEYYSCIVNQRCSDLLDIINDILDIAKIESGLVSINHESINLFTFFSDLKSLFVINQKKKNKNSIKFDFNFPIEFRNSDIVSDKLKLNQIFTNLLSNAFKFTKKGSIEFGCFFDAKQKLIFYVSDTGVGIPKESYDKIFERFIQLDGGETRIYGGNGLGLAISKGLVQLLGGNIWVDSKINEGSTFYFFINFETVEKGASIDATVHESIKHYNFHGKQVLVVEDDEFNSALIGEFFVDTGAVLKFVVTGGDAIKIVKETDFDLILLDIGLPDMLGYVVAREILKLQPNAKIIAQTAYASCEDRKRAFESGCIEHISKPLKSELLLSLVESKLI